MTPHHRLALRLLPGIFLFLLACAVLVAALAAEPAAAVRYVAPGGADETNLCLDPAAPCGTVAHALARSLPGDTLSLAAGTYNEAGLTVPHAMLLRGDGEAVLDGGGRDTVLIVAPGVSFVVEDVTIRDGYGARGGAIRVETGGSLTLRRVELSGNRAGQGGAVYAVAAVATVEDSRLADNEAGAGGAIYIESGNLTIARSELIANRAGSGGGLFAGPGAMADLHAVTLSGNEAATVGGGIHAAGGLAVLNTVVRDNRAAVRGGGLLNDHGTATIDYTTFLANYAPAGAAVATTGLSGLTHLRSSILVGRDLCDGATSGSGNLASDSSCGAPAQAATGLDAGGRPTHGSNAIDAGTSGACLAGGATMTVDLRGEQRPVDGNRDGSARCDIGAFEFQPRLTILHTPSLTDGARFAYGGDLGDFELSASEQPRHIFEAAPGVYRIEQRPEPGWKLNNLTCAGDTDGGTVIDTAARAAVVDLDPGETITCAFTPRPNRETIGVAVRAPAGDDAAIAFSGGLGAFELRPATQPDMRSGRLAVGAHTLQLTPPPGHTVTAIACAGDRDGGTTTNPAAGLAVVDLDAKETIGCTFTLAPTTPTSLTIRHETTPPGDEPFIFTGDLGVVALRAVSSPVRTIFASPGNYRLHELLHPRWALIRLDCAGDADDGTTLLPDEASALIDLDAGEAITCTFGHARASSGAGTITIVQTANAADGTTFPFTGSLGDFSLNPPANAARTFTELRPGGYTVRQLTPAGWVVDGLSCAGDADNGTALLPDEATALIDLDEDENITCTFAATRPSQTGAITIIHEPNPADDTQFRYNGSLGGFNLRAPARPGRTYIDLTPGPYTVGSRPQDGFALTSITCEGDTDGGSAVDLPARNVTIDLDAGEAIVCRFQHLGPGVTPQPTPSPTPPPPTPPPGSAATTFLPFVKR